MSSQSYMPKKFSLTQPSTPKSIKNKTIHRPVYSYHAALPSSLLSSDFPFRVHDKLLYPQPPPIFNTVSNLLHILVRSIQSDSYDPCCGPEFIHGSIALHQAERQDIKVGDYKS